ncbi:MAG: carboxypeptidase regulatory-like domain-containing protein, partial [Gammaproteobacteria bacterium]|nr:carboxypeptidase regulatory-like domain-containing protein [Gammaproteobacteria bacterium]
LNENNTFYLDTARNEVIIKGVSSAYNKSLVYVLDDDIYIDGSLLSRWFDITINADLFASSITFNSKDPFPFILRKQREEKIAKSRARLNADVPYYPYHYEPYDMVNVPFIDQTFESTNRYGPVGSANTLNSITYVTADLLGMSSSLYLFATQDEVPDDVRFTLGKKDPESELLGFAHASEYAMGHIFEPRLKNITVPGEQEPGALISSFPLNQQAEYDRHRFTGNLLPGWEVELYHNDRLIGYQSSPVEGQYDFDDIPILFGRNYFRLVFYGPQGQVREQEEVFELGESLTKKGQHYYRVLASDNEEGGSRVTAQYDIGLTDKISASFIGASVPLNLSSTTIEQHSYVQVGIRGFWKSFFATVDVIDDVDGGEAINFDFQTGIGSSILKFNHTILNQFFSEEYQLNSQEFNNKTEIRIDTTIPPSFLPRIPFSLELRMSDFVSGNDRNELINLMSLQTYGLSLSNQLTYVQNSTSKDLFSGSFGLSSYLHGTSVRGTINYAFEPIDEVTSVDLTVRPRLYKKFQFTYGLNHSLVADLTQVSASASKAIGKYNLSFGLRYDTDEVFSFDARFSVGIGREPRQKEWVSDALAIAGRGSVSARVFLDNNQDGLYNEGDEPVEDVGFTLNGGYEKTKTDKNGIAYITGIPEHRPVNLAIKNSTLSDPLWTEALDGMRIVPRPGQAMQLDFPVFTTGEIDGTIYLFKNNREIGAGRVKVEVVNKQGRIVRSTTTEYDGFYVVSNIPLGHYSVRVSPEQMSELNLQVENESSIVISADDQFKSGVDFKLLDKVQ